MIIIEPCAGLGNRFIALASAYHAAKQLDKELVVIWKEESVLGAPMSALFELPREIKCVEISEYGYKQNLLGQLHGNRIKKKYRTLAGKFYECDDIMKLYDEKGREGVADQFMKYTDVYVKATNPFWNIFDIDHAFDFISPKGAIEERKKQVLKEAEEKRLVGVHIRRTDHVESIRNSPLELFIEKMQEELEKREETFFYVATDDLETEETLRRKFGKRVLTFSGKTLERSSRQGIEDAYVEMLCLSAGDKILGSFNSTFSVMASRLGNIPLEVVKREQ